MIWSDKTQVRKFNPVKIELEFENEEEVIMFASLAGEICGYDLSKWTQRQGFRKVDETRAIDFISSLHNSIHKHSDKLMPL
jgi:threonine dehydrogenase-like Zn-dependent dehydrogenase